MRIEIGQVNERNLLVCTLVPIWYSIPIVPFLKCEINKKNKKQWIDFKIPCPNDVKTFQKSLLI